MALLQSLITVVLFLAILGSLVVIHELGHFIVARLAGIRVWEFGIGFPPRATVLARRGETLYTLNWLPIGGFVKLEGEEGESDDPRSLVRASLPIRALVFASGAIMNVILAFALMVAIAWFPQTAYGLTFAAVQAGSPAAAAGLAPGDLIVSLDGRHYDQIDPQVFISDLRAAAGRTVTLGVVRGGGATATAATVEQITATLRPPSQIDAGHGALGIEQLRYVPSTTAFTRTPAEAVATGSARTADAFSTIAHGLAGIADAFVTRPTQAPEAAGPIGIAATVGDVFWQVGIGATLYLAALISANLALFNMLPFPPLDGGRIVMAVIKSLVGTRVSVRIERLTYLVGFAFLFAFLIWVTFFDIARLGGAIQ
ncbi:MAG TPA: M50 family metallopeptidase [Candidatus Limnocylindrales bacterium]